MHGLTQTPPGQSVEPESNSGSILASAVTSNAQITTTTSNNQARTRRTDMIDLGEKEMTRSQAENFAFHLYLIRKERGISQTELGKMAGLDQSTIALYENDGYEHQTEEIMKRIAKALRTSYEDMIRTPADSLSPLKRVRSERTNLLAMINNLYKEMDKSDPSEQLKLISTIMKKINLLRAIALREREIMKEDL